MKVRKNMRDETKHIWKIALIFLAIDVILQIAKPIAIRTGIPIFQEENYAMSIIFPIYSVLLPIIVGFIYNKSYNKYLSIKKYFIIFLKASALALVPFFLIFISIGFLTIDNPRDLLQFSFLGIIPFVIGQTLYSTFFSLVGVSISKTFKKLKNIS